MSYLVQVRRYFLIVLCGTLVACSGVTSHRIDPYFGAETVAPTSIKAPYAKNSAEYNDEVDAMIHMQKSPKKKHVDQAVRERDMSPEILVLAVDKSITRDAYPAVYNLLDRVYDTSEVVTDAAKAHWNTKRPYLADKRIKALVVAHDNPAYPSGHTSDSFTLARVMGKVQPSKAKSYLRQASGIAGRRVLVGMHYPHDIEGGEQLADNIIKALEKNPEFLEDLEAAKKEIANKGA